MEGRAALCRACVPGALWTPSRHSRWVGAQAALAFSKATGWKALRLLEAQPSYRHELGPSREIRNLVPRCTLKAGLLKFLSENFTRQKRALGSNPARPGTRRRPSLAGISVASFPSTRSSGGERA